MALVLSQPKSYLWPVKVYTPADGKFETSIFSVEFKYMPQSEVSAMLGGAGDRDVIETIKPLIIGWKEVTDSDGKDIPFSPANLDKLLEVPGLAMRVFIAWTESLSGAPEKN